MDCDNVSCKTRQVAQETVLIILNVPNKTNNFPKYIIVIKWISSQFKYTYYIVFQFNNAGEYGLVSTHKR